MIFPLLIRNFVLTVLIEGLVMLALFRSWRRVYYSFLCNLLTNPALNYLLILAGSLFVGAYAPMLILLEAAVVIIEAFVYKELFPIKLLPAIGVSLLLNAASFSVGLLLQFFIP